MPFVRKYIIVQISDITKISLNVIVLNIGAKSEAYDAASQNHNFWKYLDMAIKIIRNGNIESLEEREDARKRIDEFQPIVADCRTMNATFKASIQNVSSAGVFINTRRKLSIGQEIAVTFTFPRTRQTIMLNGEIVRIASDGAGVKVRMFFKE